VRITRFAYDALHRRVRKESLSGHNLEAMKRAMDGDESINGLQPLPLSRPAIRRVDFLWNGNVLFANGEWPVFNHTNFLLAILRKIKKIS
jgi:hypothetical protein